MNGKSRNLILTAALSIMLGVGMGFRLVYSDLMAELTKTDNRCREATNFDSVSTLSKLS